MTLASIARDYLEALGQINFELSRAQKFAFSHTKYLPKDAACIKKVDIQRWLAGLEEGLAPSTIKRVVLCWRRACEQAVEAGKLAKNPFLRAKYPKIPRSKTDPFSAEEVDLMLSRASGRLESFLAFAFYTGARCCEILALRWDDIDMEAMSISISKSLTDGLVKPRTKTGEDRIVPIFAPLLPYIARLEKERDSEWVFSQKRDHLFGSTSLFGNGKWRKFLAECGIPYRSARHTRHTFATHMVERAVRGEIPLKWVSQILGHASLDMTIKVYARFLQNEHMKINREIDLFG